MLRAQEARAVEEASATAARAAVTARENYEKDAELSATKEALNTTQAELAAAQAELSGTQGDLAAARFTLNSSGAEAQQELNSMRFDLQAARTELNVTRAHLGTVRSAAAFHLFFSFLKNIHRAPERALQRDPEKYRNMKIRLSSGYIWIKRND